MIFNPAYLKDEIVKFWKMTGEKSYSVEQMDRAFEGLCICYLHTQLIDDCATTLFEAASNYWQRVRLYRILGV